MKRIVFHAEADREITEAVSYYESRSPGLGSSLIQEIEMAVDQLAENPEAFQQIGQRTRRKLVSRFPYALIYAVYSDRIRVVALAHHKRQPFYWLKRLYAKSKSR